MNTKDLRDHRCDRTERWPEYDGHGIFLCYVCDECRDAKLSRYRPEVLNSRYTSDDLVAGEQVEPYDDYPGQLGMGLGVDAWNDATGNSLSTPEPCGHHCRDCPRCGY